MNHIWPVPKTIYMSFEEITDSRAASIITTQSAWDAVKQKLNLNIASIHDITQATEAYWDQLCDEVKGEVIYAVGGGLAADTAKYIAVKKGLKVVCLPTALSVDAITAWSSAIRWDGCVIYLETKPVDQIILDFRTIAEAPAFIRAAAICDLFSIATGSWDWQFAEAEGKNPASMKMVPYVYDIAQAILQGTLDCAEAAGQGDSQGLRQLYDCVILETQLLNQIGHARPEEGSEHYFAYAVENRTGSGLPHANLVCPGILLMSALQGQDYSALKKAMKACSITLQAIPKTEIIATLLEQPAYCSQHQLPFGIAHTITAEDVEKLDIETILR